MQQKTIEILLRLNDQMNAQLSKNTATVKEASAAIDVLTAKVNKNDIAQARAASTTHKSSSAFASMGKSLMAVAAAYLSFTAVVSTAQRSLGFVVQTGMEYEQSLANTRAILQPTTRDMMALAQASKELGATTRYTAAQASDAQTEFGKLGFTTGQILGAQEAALNLAAAANLELARAAEITGVTLQQFSMNASESGKVADIMAKAANMAALDVEQFGESMKYTGTIASQSGYSIEETSAAIAVLSDEAVVGSQAGTSLRRIISTLANESSLASKEIRKLNPNATTLADKFDVLSKMGLDSSSAMKLFRIEASTAAIILANGSEELRDYTERLKDVEGYSRRVALIQMDTLAGDLLVAKSAAENLAISLSQAFGAEQRGAVQEFTKLIGEVNTWVESNPDKLRAWGDTAKKAFNLAQIAADSLLRTLKQTAFYQAGKAGVNALGFLSNAVGGSEESTEDPLTQYQRQTETVMRIIKDSQKDLDAARVKLGESKAAGTSGYIHQVRIDEILTEIDKQKELLHIKYDVIKSEYDLLKASKSLDVEQEKRLNSLSKEIDAYGLVRSEHMASAQAIRELSKRDAKLKKDLAGAITSKGGKGTEGGLDAEALKDLEQAAKDAKKQEEKMFKDILNQRAQIGLQGDELYLKQREQFWNDNIALSVAAGGRYLDQLRQFKEEEIALLMSGIGAGSSFGVTDVTRVPTVSGGYTPMTGGDSATSAGEKARQQAVENMTKLQDEAFALNQQYNLSEIEQERMKFEEKKLLLEQFNYDTTTLEQEHADKVAQITADLNTSRLESYASFAGGMATLMSQVAGKNKALLIISKGLALAQIAMDTKIAAVKGLAMPPAPNFVAAGAATLYGLASAADVAGLKFSQGGMVPSVPGVPYTGDHVPIWANPGERVLTKEQNLDYERGSGGSRVINLNYAPVYAQDTSEAQKRRDYRMFKREVRTVVDDPEFNVSQGVFA